MYMKFDQFRSTSHYVTNRRLKTLLCDVTMIHASGKYVTFAIEPRFRD